MKEKKQCKICEGFIDLEKDNYVVVTDYKEGSFYMEGYYHNLCYHKALHKKTLNTLQFNFLNKLKQITGKDGLV